MSYLLEDIEKNLTVLAFQDPDYRKKTLTNMINDVETINDVDLQGEEKDLLADILKSLLAQTEIDIEEDAKKPKAKVTPEAQRLRAKAKVKSTNQPPSTPQPPEPAPPAPPAPPAGNEAEDDVDLDNLLNDIENEF